MSDPSWREPRPGRPYGGDPRARPRGREPGPPPGGPRPPAADARTPRRDPDRGASDPRGSDPRVRDPGWGGHGSGGSGGRGSGGNGRDPGRTAGRGDDPGTDPRTRRIPARPPEAQPSRTQPPRTQPAGTQPPRTQPPRTQPAGTRPAGTRPAGTRPPMAQPGGGRDVTAVGGGRDVTAVGGGRDVTAGQAGGPRSARGRRSARRTAQRPRGPARWGGLKGGLGVCIIVASAAVGTVATMVVRSMPGPLLGLFVVAGTVTAALAVRPRAGRMILPVPVLSYLVAALTSGVVYSRSADTSTTALAISAAQWIANGFFAMAIATLLAVAITTARWYLWRRRRPATRDPGWPAPGPAPPELTRGRPPQDGPPSRGGRGRAGRLRRNPGTLRASRVQAPRARPERRAPGGPPEGSETGVLRVRTAAATDARSDARGTGPTTSPAGRNGAPGA